MNNGRNKKVKFKAEHTERSEQSGIKRTGRKKSKTNSRGSVMEILESTHIDQLIKVPYHNYIQHRKSLTMNLIYQIYDINKIYYE